MEKETKIYRIAVTGPESSGKSVLSEALANHYNTRWVPEYSRTYLADLKRDYSYKDIVRIARGQFNLEEKTFPYASQFLFCDTDFLVCKVWSEEKFGKCDPWINEMYDQSHYDLYLLCKPDLPWKADPLRENPEDRDRLFNIYRKYLEEKYYSYKIICGTGKQRLDRAIMYLDKFQI